MLPVKTMYFLHTRLRSPPRRHKRRASLRRRLGHELPSHRLLPTDGVATAAARRRGSARHHAVARGQRLRPLPTHGSVLVGGRSGGGRRRAHRCLQDDRRVLGSPPPLRCHGERGATQQEQHRHADRHTDGAAHATALATDRLGTLLDARNRGRRYRRGWWRRGGRRWRRRHVWWDGGGSIWARSRCFCWPAPAFTFHRGGCTTLLGVSARRLLRSRGDITEELLLLGRRGRCWNLRWNLQLVVVLSYRLLL